MDQRFVKAKVLERAGATAFVQMQEIAVLIESLFVEARAEV